MKNIESYKLFENIEDLPTLIDITSIDEFKISFSEEFNDFPGNWEQSDKFKYWNQYFLEGVFDM